jgi:hypothetical protein
VPLRLALSSHRSAVFVTRLTELSATGRKRRECDLYTKTHFGRVRKSVPGKTLCRASSDKWLGSRVHIPSGVIDNGYNSQILKGLRPKMWAACRPADVAASLKTLSCCLRAPSPRLDAASPPDNFATDGREHMTAHVTGPIERGDGRRPPDMSHAGPVFA